MQLRDRGLLPPQFSADGEAGRRGIGQGQSEQDAGNIWLGAAEKREPADAVGRWADRNQRDGGETGPHRHCREQWPALPLNGQVSDRDELARANRVAPRALRRTERATCENAAAVIGCGDLG